MVSRDCERFFVGVTSSLMLRWKQDIESKCRDTCERKVRLELKVRRSKLMNFGNKGCPEGSRRTLKN